MSLQEIEAWWAFILPVCANVSMQSYFVLFNSIAEFLAYIFFPLNFFKDLFLNIHKYVGSCYILATEDRKNEKEIILIFKRLTA